MTSRRPLNFVYLIIVINLLIATGCLVLSDRMIVTLMENVRIIGLSGEVEKGRPAVESEIKTLEREVARLDSTVAITANRQLPTLQDLKELQSRHHLSLVQMERISKAVDKSPGVLEYNTVFTGTVGGLIRFLQELESVYIVKSEQVMFRPANEDGSIVALGLSLTVREE
jgi:hypothetical protein